MGTMARRIQSRSAVDSEHNGYDSMNSREPVSKGYKQDIALEECAAESDVDAAAMNRALGLLARWNTTTKGATQGV